MFDCRMQLALHGRSRPDTTLDRKFSFDAFLILNI